MTIVIADFIDSFSFADLVLLTPFKRSLPVAKWRRLLMAKTGDRHKRAMVGIARVVIVFMTICHSYDLLALHHWNDMGLADRMHSASRCIIVSLTCVTQGFTRSPADSHV